MFLSEVLEAEPTSNQQAQEEMTRTERTRSVVGYFEFWPRSMARISWEHIYIPVVTCKSKLDRMSYFLAFHLSPHYFFFRIFAHLFF